MRRARAAKPKQAGERSYLEDDEALIDEQPPILHIAEHVLGDGPVGLEARLAPSTWCGAWRGRPGRIGGGQ